MEDFGLYHLEAEQAVVGAIFKDESLIKECTIESEHLYSRKLRKLFMVMKELDRDGKPIDIVSVVERAGLMLLDEIGGVSFIMEVARSCPTTANFSYYEGLVMEYFQKRKTVEVANQILQETWTNDISDTIQRGVNNLMAIEAGRAGDDVGLIRDSLVELYDQTERDGTVLPGIATGFADLDRLLMEGLKPKDLVIVGARPSVGKSAFAVNLALKAVETDVCIIFSLEMPKAQMVKRAISCLGGIHNFKMAYPKRDFDENDWKNYSAAMGVLSKANLRIIDQSGLKLNEIWSKVRKIKREFGDEKKFLVIIDYLQLVQGDPKHKGNRYNEISEVSRMLKEMARQLDVAVVALSQLSRNLEGRQNKLPLLSDLRESGQIEQDADIILFLHRGDYYPGGDAVEKDTMDIVVAKHRHGALGTVKLKFRKEIGRFVE
ncbi:replicative DNA helicase [Pseudoneobacillus sp. C159]